MSLITSLQNPRVKEVARLRDRRGRNRLGRIVIDGARELLRAVEGGVKIDELYWCEELADGSSDARRLRAKLQSSTESSYEFWQVTRPVFEKLTFGERIDGVVGVAQVTPLTLDQLTLQPSPLLVVVEGVEKPGNLGAILRTADATGVAAVILCDGGTDWHNPNVIRASMGTVFTVPVCSADAAMTRQWLKQQGVRVLAARVEGAVRPWDANWIGAVAVVLGAESTGLSAIWSGKDVTAVALPMLGAADSLNVSATAAVLCYEALRQRGTGS
ncbi:MAG: RNA methyltransferase [Pirellulales bacterium]